MTSTPAPSTDDAPDGHPVHEGEGAHGEHRSGWPLVSAVGAGTLYVGVGLIVLAYSAETVRPALGVVVAVTGALGTTAGLFGWLREAFLRRYRSRPGGRETRRLYVLTMLLFLSTDLGTFGAGFVYYAFIRIGTWPPSELPSLLGSLVAINTAILLASSVTFHVAHDSLERGNRRRFLALLGVTVGLGAVFLAGQALEYYEFLVAEGFGIEDGIFASAFYGLTGLHGLHVALGVVLLSVVLVRGLRGHYSPERDTSVATVGLYWHFVDAVWLFLVGVLYVGAEVTL